VLSAGDRVGDWVIEDRLGEGGMGAVYRVHSVMSDRVVAALKILKPSAGSEARVRFIREAEALSTLSHPAIVRVMAVGEDPGRELPYLPRSRPWPRRSSTRTPPASSTATSSPPTSSSPRAAE